MHVFLREEDCTIGHGRGGECELHEDSVVRGSFPARFVERRRGARIPNQEVANNLWCRRNVLPM